MKRLLLFAIVSLLAACSSSSPQDGQDGLDGADILYVDLGHGDAPLVDPETIDAVQDVADSTDLDMIPTEDVVPDGPIADLQPLDLQVDDLQVDAPVEVDEFYCGDDECGDDEDCDSCPEDCGDCPPLLNWCLISGNEGDKVQCEIRLVAEDESSPKATQFQLDMDFEPAQVAYDGITCPADGVDLCDLVGVLPTQHAINTAEQSPGVVRLIITKPGEPAPISDAYLSGDSVVGDPYVLDLIFSLTTTISEEAPVMVSLTNMVGSDATGNPLNADQDPDGMIVTGSDSP